MGGGVSLGSFSGAGLTESLKLLILYGQDENGEPFDDVIVDGMSGASAGAMALTIMLKCLINYKEMITHVNSVNPKANLSEAKLEKALKETYFKNGGYKDLSDKKKEDLKALELAQIVQRILWVDEITVKKLLNEKLNGNNKNKLNEGFSLLDRGYLDSLAEKYLLKSKFNSTNINVLDKTRVLFACSLTNLLPIPMDVSGEDKNESSNLELNILNSTGGYNHKEIRVMDFVFDNNKLNGKETDSRWLKFCQNHSHEYKTNDKVPIEFELLDERAWSTVSASALACGAFPFAFPPVLLKRYEREFFVTSYYKESKQAEEIDKRVAQSQKIASYESVTNKNVKNLSEWPPKFRNLTLAINKNVKNNNSYFYSKSDFNEIDYKSFNFPYIDGGVLNNEPIREAFRIASFQDFGTFDSKTTERLILFVDPIVRKERDPSFQQSGFNPVKSEIKTKTLKIIPNNRIKHIPTSELTKFTGSVRSVIGLLKNQGTIKEENKISDVKESFELLESLDKILIGADKLQLTFDLIRTAYNKMKFYLSNDIISIGTRDPLVYFINEIKESAKYKKLSLTKNSPLTDLNALSFAAEKILNPENKDQPKNISFIQKTLLYPKSDETIFAYTIYKIIADISLRIAGKNQEANRIAILPTNTDLDIINLPGVEMAAFGGFASVESRIYASEYAKRSTLISLNEANGFKRKEMPYVKIEKEKYVGLLKDNEKLLNNSGFFENFDKFDDQLTQELFSPIILRIRGIFEEVSWLLKQVLRRPSFIVSLVGGPIIGVFGTIGALIGGKKSWNFKNIVESAIIPLASKHNFIYNRPITIMLKSKVKIDTKVKLHTKFGKAKKIIGYINPLPTENEYELYFNLFIPNHESEIRLDWNEKFAIPDIVDEVGVLDRNINPDKWKKRINHEMPAGIQRIDIRKRQISLNSLNDKKSSLYYSLKNLQYHINPMLVLDLDEEGDDWYFIDKTRSLDEELLQIG